MSRLLIVVDRAKDWAPYYPSTDVLTFDQYLQFSAPAASRVRVINLCQSARYLSRGYYCSLLAEARGHNVVPSVMTLNDLSREFSFSEGSAYTHVFWRVVPAGIETGSACAV